MSGVGRVVKACLLAGASILLGGCGPRLTFNGSQSMTPDQMLDRASHVFVGVIQEQKLESISLFDRPAGFHRPAGLGDPQNDHRWKILRRRVSIEMVLRGVEPRKAVDVYEIPWSGAAMGDWNSTQNGERDLFLVNVENGRYHVVRDFWRSIFPVTTGPHSRLPLDDSHPLWERIALMNFWIERSDPDVHVDYPFLFRADPGGALSEARVVKLERGLARHPSSAVRLAACRQLELRGEDECWNQLSPPEQSRLADSCPPCAVNHRAARNHEPHEREATIVTAQGDVRSSVLGRTESCNFP